MVTRRTSLCYEEQGDVIASCHKNTWKTKKVAKNYIRVTKEHEIKQETLLHSAGKVFIYLSIIHVVGRSQHTWKHMNIH